MTDGKLPEWPVWPSSSVIDPRADTDYYEQLAQAALARLRVAVEALQLVTYQCAFEECGNGLRTASKALSTIGELPK